MHKITQSEIKAAAVFGAAGFVIAVVMEAILLFVQSQPNYDAKLALTVENLSLVLWPTSIMLMAVQHSGLVGWLILMVSAAANAFLYGLIGFATLAVYRKLHGIRAHR